MKTFVLSIVAASALSVAAAAQTSNPGNPQGTQSSSPTMQNPNSQPGTGQPGTYPQSGPSDQSNTNMGNQSEKGEKKMKGCVTSQGGQAMLETKKGKQIALSGQDVSAHNGHEVEVKGAWASGSAGMAPSSAGAGSSADRTFNVTEVKMISDTCKNKGSSSPSGTGSGSNPTQPQ